ncbi:MAG: nucleotidyltransferase family protein [Aigarchaeota archaeon]|nr:nucleotidyltransferase family protein [Aigarchaeota archaeon]
MIAYAIVLAAGGSTRMRDKFKLTVDLGGRPLVLWSVYTALRSSVKGVIVVTGNRADEVEGVLPRDVKVVRNAEWREGMSSSIRAGVRALPDSVEALVILVGDQPFVRSSTIDRLVEALRRGRVVAYCTLDGDVRNPVAFRRVLFPELSSITGDRGAKELVRRHLADGEGVTVDPIELLDVDTETDLMRALDLARSRSL